MTHKSTPSRQNILIATLLGCSAMVVAPAASSYAASAISAKTSWSVSRVASATQGSYCTMAQKYADDTVLTFAQNSDQEYSLALDFKDDVFKEGQKQKITLRPEGGVAQSYTVTPQSENTAVVGIGSDKNFMAQITRNENLGVDVNGKVYSFSLSQFQSGQSELKNCLNSEKDSKSSIAKADTKASQPAADAALSAEGLLAAKPMSSDDMMITAAKEPVAIVPVIQKAAKPVVSAVIPAHPVVVEPRKIAEAKITEDKPVLVQQASPPVPTMVEDSNEVLKLRSDIKQLTAKLDLVQSEKAAIQNTVSKLQNQQDDKQLKLAGGNFDLEQATRRYQESQREIQRLGATIQTQDAKCTAEKKEIENMLFDPAITDKAQVAMLSSLEDDVKSKTQKIKELEQAIQAEKSSVAKEKDAQIQALKDDAQKISADKEAVLVGLKADLVKKNSELQAAKAQEEMLVSLKTELAAKNKELSDSQLKVSSLESSQTKLQNAEQSVADIKTELDKKTIQLTEIQTKLAEAVRSQSALATIKDTEISALKTQVSQLQAQALAEQAKAQQVNVAAEAKQNSQQAAVIASMQAQIQQGNQKISELQSQITGMRDASVRVAAVAPAAASSTVPSYSGSVASAMPPQTLQRATPVVPDAPHFKSMEDFANLLNQSGITTVGGLKSIQGSNQASYRAYSWKTESLYGSVEMRSAPSQAAFETSIDQYLARAKSRCSGEFAAVPSQAGGNSGKSYEIACVGQNGATSSASVLFSYGDGIAMTIAHEGREEAMDLAIDARDKIASHLN